MSVSAGTVFIDAFLDVSKFKQQLKQALDGVQTQTVQVQGDTSKIKQDLQGTKQDADKAGKQAGDSYGSGFSGGLKNSIKGGAAAAGVAVGVGLAAGLDAEAAGSKLKAQLGLTAKESKAAGKLAGDLYSNAYGESMEEVNTAIGSVISSIQGMRGATDETVKRATTRALDFAAAFDIDVSKAVASVGTLMKSGLAKDSKQAFDLITKASQAVPASLREDVLDASDEYGQFFNTLGFNGKDAFEVLVKGAEKGQFGIDKAGDAIKEFTIRSTDMSTASQDAYKSIGLDARDMANAILAGGPSAKKATGQIIDGLLAVKDPAKRAENAIALFGTPMEDLNVSEIPKFLKGLKGGGDAMDGFKGSTDRMGAALNDNAKVKFEAFKRQTLAVAMALGNTLIPAIAGVASAIGATIGFVVRNKDVFIALTAVATALAARFIILAGAMAIGAVVNAVTVAIIALNLAILANPIGALVIALAALGAGLVLAYRESETFRNIVDSAFTAVKSVAVSVFGFLKDFIPGVWNAIRQATQVIWTAINAYFTPMILAIKFLVGTVFPAMRDVIVGAWNAVRSVTTTVWNAIRSVLTGVFSAIRAAVELYFNAYRTIIVGVWTAVSTVTSTVWNTIRGILTGAFSAIRGAVSTAFDAVRSKVVGTFNGILEFVGNLVGRFTSAGQKIGGAIVGGITDFLGKGIKSVAGFAIKILNVVGKIPGVDSITDPAVKGIKEIAGLRRGGAFGRTGGVIDQPIVMMGEEAPRHPEFVIPSNPAYRDRAQMLVRQAAHAVGLARGGVFESTSYGPPWGGINGTGVTATGVNLKSAPAVYGVAVDPSVIKLGESIRAWPNPFGHKGEFKAFDTGGAIKGNRLDFYDWRGRAEQLGWGRRMTEVSGINDGGGLGGLIKGAVGKVGGVLGGLLAKGAGFLLKLLPGAGSLPDWLQGLGSKTLGAVTEWIKDKVSGVIGLGGGGGAVSGGVSGSIQGAMALARSMGLQITSTTGGQHAKNSWHYKGRAADVAGPPGAMAAFFNEALSKYGKNLLELFYDPLGAIKNGSRIPAIGGHNDHVHIALAKGGEWGGPLGSYQQGTPYVPRTGPYLLHQGEAVIPAGQNPGSFRVVVEGGAAMQWLEQFVRVEIDQHDGELAGLRAAGVAP